MGVSPSFGVAAFIHVFIPSLYVGPAERVDVLSSCSKYLNICSKGHVLVPVASLLCVVTLESFRFFQLGDVYILNFGGYNKRLCQVIILQASQDCMCSVLCLAVSSVETCHSHCQTFKWLLFSSAQRRAELAATEAKSELEFPRVRSQVDSFLHLEPFPG